MIDPDINYLDGLFNSVETAKQSSYTSVENLNSLISNKNFVSFMTYNIRSFNANADTFFSMFQNNNCFPKILTLTETWFSDSNMEDIPGYSSYHTIRTSGRSGGVSTFVKEELDSCLLTEFTFSNTDIEVCSVRVSINSLPVIIVSIYRPHSGTVSNFNNYLSRFFDNPSIRNNLCVVLGDLNINILTDSPDTNSFIYNMQSHHFYPFVTKPTRFSPVNGISSTLLDHVWCNNLNLENSCSIIMNDFTDHCPVLFQLNLGNVSETASEKIKITFRCINEANRGLFEDKLSNFDWRTLKTNDVNSYLENLLNTINSLYCESFPLKIKFVSKKQISKPWITPGIKKLIYLKSKYFQLLKLGIITNAENNTFKNRIKSIIEKSKKSYLNNYFIKYKSNLRKTWEMIKVLTAKNFTCKNIKRIVWNSIEYTTDYDIANAFNRFFCSVAVDLDNCLPNSTTDPLNFLNRNNLNSFYLYPVTPSECCKIVKSLKNSKQKINSISLPMFKLFVNYFVDVLCDLINTAFSSGIFPDLLKIAQTIPIFKKGDNSNISNYRPISTLPFISKVFEKLMHARIVKYLMKNQILTSNQYGFLKGKSTEGATLKLVEYLHETLNSRLISINVFIDFKKAFDTLNHGILARKLEAYGIRGPPLRLIVNYLQNRTQYVKINGTFSNVGHLTLGIPQGSVLGPLLFLIYINDLPNISENFQSIMFADDTTLSFRGGNPAELTRLCNAELSGFSEWAIANRLSISSEKTFFNVVSNLSIDQNFLRVSLNNRPIVHTSPITYLGVVFDEKLRFREHIEFISCKISKSIGVLNRIKHFTPHFTMKTLYYSLIHPYLNYYNLIWGGTFQTHLDPLFVLQKKAIRIINNVSYLHHTHELFFRNKILKLNDIHKLNLAKYMFNLSDHSNFSRSHEHQTRSQHLLNPIFQRLTSTQMSVSYSGPHEWNNLPNEVKNSSSYCVFKKRAKNNLIHAYNLNV